MALTINPGQKPAQDDKIKEKEQGKKDNNDNEKFSPGEPDDYDAEEFATD
jgi:hypothetical protein